MATALSVLAPEWVTIDGSDFYIAPLSGIDQLRVSQYIQVSQGGEKVVVTADGCDELILLGLKGWKNFNDAEGAPVAFNAHAQKQNIARLPLGIVQPLATAILATCEMGVEDEKKS